MGKYFSTKRIRKYYLHIRKFGEHWMIILFLLQYVRIIQPEDNFLVNAMRTKRFIAAWLFAIFSVIPSFVLISHYTAGAWNYIPDWQKGFFYNLFSWLNLGVDGMKTTGYTRVGKEFFRNVSEQKGWPKTKLGWEPVSIVNYTRHGTCINCPLL